MWEEMPQELLDENKQKVREAGRQALIAWARGKGEGTDYTECRPSPTCRVAILPFRDCVANR